MTIILMVRPMTAKNKKPIIKLVGIATPTSMPERMPRAATTTIITKTIASVMDASNDPNERMMKSDWSNI